MDALRHKYANAADGRRRSLGPLCPQWAAHDLGNTAYSALIVSAFFPLYFTNLCGVNWPLGAASTAAMLLAAISVPFAGALTDHMGHTKRYLARTTLACIFFLCLLAVTTLLSAGLLVLNNPLKRGAAS